MKTKPISSTLLLLSLFYGINSYAEDAVSGSPSCIKSGMAYSQSMSMSQRKELFVKGTITDCDDKVWDIIVIPGSDVSKEMSVRALKRSEERIENNTAHLVHAETYTNMGSSIAELFHDSSDLSVRGLDLMKEGAYDDALVDGLGNTLLKRTGQNWMHGFSTASQIAADGNFGWVAGSLYTGLIKPIGQTVWNISEALVWDVALKGGGKFVWGAGKTLVGAAGMVVSPVVSPGYEIIIRPLGSLVISIADTIAIGGLASGSILVWNGTAWTLSQFYSVPTRESSIAGVNFVNLQFDPNDPRNLPKITNVDFSTFSQMIQSQLRWTQATHEINTLRDKINTRDKEIEKLEKDLNKLRDENRVATEKIYDVKNQTNSDPVVASINSLMYDVRHADEINISDDVNLEINSKDSLVEVILETSREMNIDVSDEEVHTIAEDIIKTFENTLTVKKVQ